MLFHQAHCKGELKNPYFFVRIINERIKLTTFSYPFLTSLYYNIRVLKQVECNSGIKTVLHVKEFIHFRFTFLSYSGEQHMIRITTEIKINGES